jgi:hypothetical protein
MPLRDHWWCILVAKYGAFLFTEIGAFVITDYSGVPLPSIFVTTLFYVGTLLRKPSLSGLSI